MFSPIVHSNDPITLVGGGHATPLDLHKALTLAPQCVAADGGAQLALTAGVEIAAVIGDFDSVSDQVLGQIPENRRHHIAEQDSTDFGKCLRHIDAPLVLGVGFLGLRVDHQLAALNLLGAMPDRPCVLLGEDEVICLAPPRIELPTEAGDVVSLFPLGPVRGQSTGLEWPIDGLDFAPMAQIGTSNRAKGPVTLEMEAPAMLLIVPRRFMPDVVSEFLRPQAERWPARAE